MTEPTELTSEQQKLAVAIFEYLSIVDGIYGAFHDACRGFHLVREQMINLQNYAKAQHGFEPDDSKDFLYGKGDPNQPSSTLLHKVSQGELKKRNEKDGINTQFTAAMCVIAIYQYWEDSYRARFAEALNLQTKELIADIFGDIRLIRIALVHKQGKCDKEIERCKILKWFKDGDLVQISEDRMEEIVAKVKAFLLEMRMKHLPAPQKSQE
jgi:hypothetical protein